MAIKLKSQADHFQTDVVVEMPAGVGEVNDLLRSLKTTGEMVVSYNEGGVIGISFKQKQKISAAKSAEVRPLLGLVDKIL